MTSMKRTATEAARELNASDPLAYADRFYASFPDLLAHMAEQPKTWDDVELSAVLIEAATQLGYVS